MTDNGKRIGIYMHVAVCRSKCLYCDFYSKPLIQTFNWDRYLSALLEEFHQKEVTLEGKSEATLYIGGGTPSLIPDNLFTLYIPEFIKGIRNKCHNISEITLEVNPDDVSETKTKIWREAGINRISMGVQSLCDDELHGIGRRHDSATAISAFNILRNEFSNISLDMMFGLPGQSLRSLEHTISGFINLRPEHISAYSLMYEERTALTRLRDSGKIEEADENLSVAMFELINKRLCDAGYRRYEISNYSLPGYESRHNSAYWEGVPYIGLGPSSHSFDGKRKRQWNLPDIRRYIDAIENGMDISESEILGDEELREEYIMTSLRTINGINLHVFSSKFGYEALDQLLQKAASSINDGSLKNDGANITLTDKGVMISDELIVKLF